MFASTSIVLGVSFFFAFPFFWMGFATFKTNLELFTPIPILPNSFTTQFYKELFSGEWIPFFRQYYNSLFIAISQTTLATAFSVMAGYVFGRYTFRFKLFFFSLAMSVILLPRQVLVLPLFIWLNKLQLIDTPYAVILPGLVSGIGLLFFAQVFRQMPGELFDLARTEGVNEYKILWVVLPLIKPAVWTYALIHFILAWHEHIIPLVMLSTPEHLTVTVALASLAGSGRVPLAMLMVGSLFIVVPSVIIFLWLYRHFKSALADLMAQ